MMALRRIRMASRRRHSRGLSIKLKDLPRMRRLKKINNAIVEMANNSKLGVDDYNIGKLLEVVPEELNSEELLELEQKHIAEKAREKETAGEEREKLPRKCTVKKLAEPFADLNKLLRHSENMLYKFVAYRLYHIDYTI